MSSELGEMRHVIVILVLVIAIKPEGKHNAMLFCPADGKVVVH